MPNATAINKRQEYLTNDSHSEYQYIYGNKENGKVVRSDKKLDDQNLVLITRDLTGMRHSLPKEDEVEFEEDMSNLSAMLADQIELSSKLDAAIKTVMGVVGYAI